MRRINQSWTSAIEEPLLKKIVPFIPVWITPDILTYAAVISMFLGGVLYFFYPQHSYSLLLVNLCIFTNWLTDGTDGKVAKYRNISRPEYGSYVDHSFDTLSIAFICLGLAFSKATTTDSWFILTTIILVAHSMNFLKVAIIGNFYLSISGISGTDARVFIILMNFLVFAIGNRVIYGYSLLDIFGILFSAIAIVLLVKEFLTTSRRLAKIKYEN
jgi:phosphatidylglycerophosphate synthase